MVKLTVLYNLPPGADHAEFLRWRTATHQKENMAMPGVVKTDVHVVQSAWKRDQPPYRFMSEANFPDMETFEKSFSDLDDQGTFTKSLERKADPLFLISEKVISEAAKPQVHADARDLSGVRTPEESDESKEERQFLRYAIDITDEQVRRDGWRTTLALSSSKIG